MPTIPHIPRELALAHALIRFTTRMLILGILAAVGSQGFARTLVIALAFAVLYCVFVATIRRESLFAPCLTHFDEAAAYAAIAHLVYWVSAA